MKILRRKRASSPAAIRALASATTSAIFSSNSEMRRSSFIATSTMGRGVCQENPGAIWPRMGSGCLLLLLPETEPGRELPAQPDHFAAERRLDLFVRQAMRRPGDAYGSAHLPGVIPDRGGAAPQPSPGLLE